MTAHLSEQRATLPPMTTPDLASWRERAERILAERGMTLADVPEPARTETDEDAAERRAHQAANKATRWRARLPIMYQSAHLNDLDDEQHALLIRTWLDAESATLILAGTVGSGKTHAAYAVGNAAVARGLWTEAVSVHDLLAALRPEGDRDLAWAARNCQVLLLDDLGAQKASAFAQEELTALLDVRLNQGLRQVITTNATAPLIEEAWGGRFVDRLRFRATVLRFAGESRRGGW